ncbi:MAG: helix-turn-helix transcriptional regulator [Opitutales bacterium]|nr:helix-turn-helix transcriptional regulator [Opitutales bacterium]
MKKELQRILSGFIRLHILHHAAERAVYGQWMMEELREHGYRISPGTLYPMLRGLERDGLLQGIDDPATPRKRLYRITAAGKEALREARERLRELFHEVEGGGPES